MASTTYDGIITDGLTDEELRKLVDSRFPRAKSFAMMTDTLDHLLPKPGAPAPEEERPVHSELGASSMSRWANCPGSVKLCRHQQRYASTYADAGTAAHALIEEFLLKNLPVSDLTFRLGSTHVSGHAYDVDDLHAVEQYINRIRTLIATCSKWWVERRIKLDDLFPDIDVPLFGTCDFMGIAEENGRTVLYIVDYKHGKGVGVTALDNPQLLYYAAGALILLRELKLPVPDEIRLEIAQPRHSDEGIQSSVDTWSIVDLTDWIFKTLKPAVLAALKPDAALVPGPKWCQFCPAKAVCPALHKKNVDAAKKVFEKIEDEEGVDTLSVLTDVEIGHYLSTVIRIGEIETALRAEISQRLDHGHKVPGWKLVDKRAVRHWVDVGVVEKFIEEHSDGTPTDVFERKLRSPTQVEKLDKNLYKALDVEGLVSRESTGTTLVPENDPRPAKNTPIDKVFTSVDIDPVTP